MLYATCLVFLFAALVQGGSFEDCTQNHECDGYEYEDTAANLDTLCTAMPWMIGCSFRVFCTNGDFTDPTVCNEFSLLGDICIADPGMDGMLGCENYLALCDKDDAQNNSPQCTSNPPLPSIIGSSATKSAVIGMCEMHTGMAGCDTCNEDSCPDPLHSIAQICLSMYMDGCDGFNDMKNTNEDALLPWPGVSGDGSDEEEEYGSGTSAFSSGLITTFTTMSMMLTILITK